MTALGRITPPDLDHVEKYALADLTHPVTHVPVVIGINWYEGFDQPQVQRHPDGDVYYIGNTSWGQVRGGHCVCLEPAVDPEIKGDEQDADAWWKFYDQGQEGACVGFGTSRMMSLINRHRYDAEWLYHEARKVGGYDDSPDEGAYVRDAIKVLLTEGHRVAHLKGSADPVKITEGVKAVRWATQTQQVLDALGTPDADHVVILNSWGVSFPHRVRLAAEKVQRLIDEHGEFGVVTDR